jgi:hypothetical protein
MDWAHLVLPVAKWMFRPAVAEQLQAETSTSPLVAALLHESLQKG